MNSRSLFILMWALTPLVSALGARYTVFPNQIYVIYEMLVLTVGLSAVRNFGSVIRAQLGWLLLLAVYCVTFFTVSYFGVDFFTSINYGVFYLPLILLEFMIAYTIGFSFSENVTFKYLMYASIVLMAYTLLEMVISPSQQRFVTTLNIPMATPIFVFSGHFLMALISIIVLALSLKKTIAAIGVMSFGLAFFVRNYVKPTRPVIRRFYKKREFVIGVVSAVAFSVVLTAILMGYSSYLLGTLARFSEDEDTSRSAIAFYSVVFLAQYFPWGVGLGGFSYLSQDLIPYEVSSARGDVIAGANLHNSFMTWALEGGWPIMLIIAFLLWKLFSVSWRLFRNPDAKMLGATLLIWLLSGMLFGAFQQWHNSGTFWSLFGFAFGCSERYRRLALSNSSFIAGAASSADHR